MSVYVGIDVHRKRSQVAVVSEDGLMAALKKVHDTDPDMPVLIKADEESQVKKLAFVMDACRKANLNKFSLQSR